VEWAGTDFETLWNGPGLDFEEHRSGCELLEKLSSFLDDLMLRCQISRKAEPRSSNHSKGRVQ
jgi:hypothetical protein